MTPVYMRQSPYTHPCAEPVIAPYSPEPYDRCGRCEWKGVVATAHYVNHWVINVCDDCLTPKEHWALQVVIADELERLA